jgi:predicted polyphosphate/ATP-dependent NAD kinase
MFKLGLIINPFAGIGGRVGLKGSDGDDIRAQAFERGAEQLAGIKTKNCFAQLTQYLAEIKVYTASGDMGETLCQSLELDYELVFNPNQPSTESDTKGLMVQLQKLNLDLVLFVGGDGTARNLFEVYDDYQAVLGIPAGVKIHSGVYANSAESAGLLVKELIQGKMLSLIEADVVDIDEQAFREGVVKARKYGYLQIPASMQYVQAVKNGNIEAEELVLEDIAAEVIESMEDDTYYVIGSGTTCAFIMQQLGLPNTLLGSDIVYKESLVKSDAVEKDLIELLESGANVVFIMTLIGGQGHILGRGNHQISPKVIRLAGWKQFQIIATKAKLEGLDGRPLQVDSGDLTLDHELFGRKKVITGYRDYVLYPVGFSQS